MSPELQNSSMLLTLGEKNMITNLTAVKHIKPADRI